jgi:hypothetical protein
MKKIVSLLIILCFLFGAGIVLAQKDLETDYPEAGGISPDTVATPLPEYVKYIFNFAIWIAGALALVFMVIGGVKYLLSAGNPSLQGDARGQILSALLGLVIILSSYLLLTTINPQLVFFETKSLTYVPTKNFPGAWLCKEKVLGFEEYEEIEEGSEKKELAREISQQCLYVSTTRNLPSIFEDKVKYIYLVEGEQIKFAAVVNEEKNWQGFCQIFMESGSYDSVGISSVVLIKIPFEEIETGNVFEEGVTVYKDTDFQGTQKGPYLPGEGNINRIEFTDLGTTGDTSQNIFYSMKIVPDYKYVAVAFTGYFQGHCQVFDESDSNLEDDPISNQEKTEEGEFISYCSGYKLNYREPCVSSIAVIGGDLVGDLPF